ncbi:uncharacterized protein LOC126764084 isoform X1 [Bactrocera neohumeralis]|uniref:uncharacterized protein LOC120780652 n=1 Tax=Bactrocera tryoni TaxID=59916 RepID=UPI001A96B43E|nr:uncharacterized protein LOC120780652 [Bactrocera tryoni]XP_050337829.1 uncharacterized protein LOC126764084 isoform X1 [Bactrocera neohumeralis]XP_050337835.1 uncharacterized protein LOC126764084 isoform X1 [Bactrocera neohumeralis]
MVRKILRESYFHAGRMLTKPIIKSFQPIVQLPLRQQLYPAYYEKKCWLQNNCTPWEQVIDYWKETSGQRIIDIYNASSLSCIFSEWPRYKDFRGYELVEIGFETLYPGKGNMLFLKLEKFYKEILKIFDRDIKDRVSRELFLKYLHIDNISNECKYCISTILLHALLQPLRLNKDKKPTIADAQADFVTLVATRNDIQPTIIELKNQFAVRKGKLQPRIIVVGSDWSSISEFYVFCDGLQWKCTTYMKCVDCIIKLSYVYKIEYSQRSKQVWAFLEQYFYWAIMPNFACFICQKAHLNSIELIKHLKSAHGTPPVCKFQCNEYNCKQIFSNIHRFQIHLKKHLKIEIANLVKKILLLLIFQFKQLIHQIN